MITSESKTDFNLRKRLDELARGECSEDDFLQNVFPGPRQTPDAAWDVLAHIDQHYRRGHLSDELFRSIESKIARQALKDSHYGRTVDLIPPVDAPADGPSTLELAAPVPVPTPSTLPSTSISPRADDLCGSVLSNRYEIESLLGEGGMGRVFKALDRLRCDLPEPCRHVALKVLHQKISERSNLLAKLRREFFCAQSLSHQNVVNVYETGVDGDLAYFTMELLHGELLSDLIERSRPQPVDRARAFEIIRAIGSGLAHAHARNLVHADLKPQNVMITREGEIRILDFGASRPSMRLGSSRPDQQCSVTPAYACCELLAGKPADPRDDLFSLACLTYELLSGRHPFDRRSSIQARDSGLKPSRPAGLSGRQWRTLRVGLAWRRADRSMSVGEWVTRVTTPSAAPEAVQAAEPMAAEGHAGEHAGERWWDRPAIQRLALWGVIAIVIGSLAANGHRLHRHDGAAERLSPRAAPTQVHAPASSVAPAVAAAAAANGSTTATPARAVRAADAHAQASAAPVTSMVEIASSAPSVSSARGIVQPATRRPNEVSAVSYRVPTGQTFAEVRVRRSDPESGDRAFMWWTVGGSAVPGQDFVPQPPTSQSFTPGRAASNLFVRLLPNPARTAPRELHVEIGKAGSDDISAPLARTTIVIPARP